MKKMNLLAILIAVTMLLSACNYVNVTEAATLGDIVAKKGDFMYYLNMGKTLAMQKAQMEGQTIATDKDWETVMLDGKTAAAYAKDEAVYALKTVMTVYAKSKEAGYVMTEQDAEKISTAKKEIIDQLGGRYEYESTLKDMGVSLDELNAIIEMSGIAEGYQAQYKAQDETLKATDEEIAKKYNEEYVFVRHILISNQAPQTDAVDPLDAENAEDYDAKAKAEAEEILKKLSEGADFVALMNEHSDDGRDAEGKLQKTGYVMTDDGQMVKPFQDAAMALSEGAYTTELVKTDYGYHIIKREALPKSGAEYDEAITNIAAVVEADKMEAKVNVWAEELGFKLNQKFIDKLRVKMEG